MSSPTWRVAGSRDRSGRVLVDCGHGGRVGLPSGAITSSSNRGLSRRGGGRRGGQVGEKRGKSPSQRRKVARI
jgi:hypothetical protein